MKVLLDMNMSDAWLAFLQGAGFIAVHWSQIGAIRDEDKVIMDYAAANGFVVLTQDLDFGALLAERGSSGPSVIQLRTKSNFPRIIGQRVVEALRELEPILAEGALVTLDPLRRRVRLLPFHYLQ